MLLGDVAEAAAYLRAHEAAMLDDLSELVSNETPSSATLRLPLIQGALASDRRPSAVTFIFVTFAAATAESSTRSQQEPSALSFES
jgi:hypothetical protein